MKYYEIASSELRVTGDKNVRFDFLYAGAEGFLRCPNARKRGGKRATVSQLGSGVFALCSVDGQSFGSIQCPWVLIGPFRSILCAFPLVTNERFSLRKTLCIGCLILALGRCQPMGRHRQRRWQGRRGESIEPFPASALAAWFLELTWSFTVAEARLRTGASARHLLVLSASSVGVAWWCGRLWTPKALERYVVPRGRRQCGGTRKAAESGPCTKSRTGLGGGALPAFSSGLRRASHQALGSTLLSCVLWQC